MSDIKKEKKNDSTCAALVKEVNSKITITLSAKWKFYFNYLIIPAVMIFLMYFSYYLWAILVPFIISFFIAYILNPIVLWFEKYFKNKFVSIAVVYVLIFSISLILFVPLITNVITEISDIGNKMQVYSRSFQKIYKDTLNILKNSETVKFYEVFESALNNHVNSWKNSEVKESSEVSVQHENEPANSGEPSLKGKTAGLNHFNEYENSLLTKTALNTGEITVKETNEITLFSKFNQIIKNNPKIEGMIFGFAEVIKDYLLGFATSILYGVSDLFMALVHYAIVPLLCFYFLCDFQKICNGLGTLIPLNYRKQTIEMMREIDSVLGTFLRGQLIVCFIVGGGFSLCLFLIGIDFAFIIGPIAGVFNLIPYLGPVVAVFPSIFLAILKWGIAYTTIFKIIWIILLVVLVHIIDGFIMQPFIAGKSFDMHPLTLMFLLLVGWKLSGIIGMFLAIPAYGVGKVVIKYLKISFAHQEI